MHGHVGAEGGDFFREALGFGAETVDPELEGVAGGVVEALPSSGLSLWVSAMGESCAACRISSE